MLGFTRKNKKEIRELINEIEHTTYENINLKKQIEIINFYLKKVKQVDEMLDKFSELKINDGYNLTSVDNGNVNIQLGEDVAIYVDDLFTGGKVIKQEANTAILIEKDGTVKKGLTKLKSDAGFSYKLKRVK